MFPQFTPRSVSARLRLNPEEEEEERKRGIADLNKRLQEISAKQPILESGGARPFSPRPELPENEAQSEDDEQPMLRSGSVRAFSHLPQPVRAQADFEGPLSTRPATPVGLFEQRSAPEAFLTQQLGKGASGLPLQQRLQGSERILAAQQQPVRGATPTASGGRLAAQQQAQPPAAAPAQNVPAAPQPPAAGRAKRQPCADCQAKLDAALKRLRELEAEEHAIRAEIGRQFKITEEAKEEWFDANAKGDDAAAKAAILKEARATATIARLQDSMFKPGQEKISIEQEIGALRSCIHSDPFELQ